LTVGIAPIIAAIIAGSAAAVTIYKFSHTPHETGTVTNTYTQTTANSGSVISEATADTVFISNSYELLVANLSQTKVQCNGNNYPTLAQTQAAAIGDFAIDAAENFSFNFQTVLDLLTSVDNRKSERGSARGSRYVWLINTVTNILLDSFQLASSLDYSVVFILICPPATALIPQQLILILWLKEVQQKASCLLLGCIRGHSTAPLT
jgi:hypothetical protein